MLGIRIGVGCKLFWQVQARLPLATGVSNLVLCAPAPGPRLSSSWSRDVRMQSLGKVSSWASLSTSDHPESPGYSDHQPYP
ncbi:hypothetical protein EV426DRAFT_583778 [Tirmania nivea]|nr:hypothetical protein EV426DRAFT_583778 [Tirmania nivea]